MIFFFLIPEGQETRSGSARWLLLQASQETAAEVSDGDDVSEEFTELHVALGRHRLLPTGSRHGTAHNTVPPGADGEREREQAKDRAPETESEAADSHNQTS